MTEKELLAARQSIVQKLSQARLEKDCRRNSLQSASEPSVPTSAASKKEHKISPLT